MYNFNNGYQGNMNVIINIPQNLQLYGLTSE